MNKKIGIVFVTLAILFYYYAAYVQGERQNTSSVSSYGQTATGTSSLVTALQASHAESISILAGPLLTEDQLASTSLLVMTSVVQAVTEHEAEVISSFVHGGGRLLLSFHDQNTQNQLQALLAELGAKHQLVPNKSFRNHQLETVRLVTDQWFFRKNEIYSIYSPLQFDRPECQMVGNVQSGNCYFDVQKLGLGQVITVLGIPFFANGLIGNADNSKLAARLFSRQDHTMFDEYHHFFAGNTLGDLLTLPAFMLPLVGLVLCLLLFFVLGPSHQVEPVAIAPLVPLRGFHDVNVALLHSELRHATHEAVTMQAKFLERYFPPESEQVDAKVKEAVQQRSNARDVFWQLCEMHQRYLVARGRRRQE